HLDHDQRIGAHEGSRTRCGESAVPADRAGAPVRGNRILPGGERRRGVTTILVIDDRAENREFIASLITHIGYRPLHAGDGAEGLAAVRAEHPELVICDVLMPTMDGFEFVRQLRADPAIAGTKVVFYTAHYQEREAWNLAESCGVLQVLVKPCE